MGDTANQDDVDALLGQLQASNAELEKDTAAIQQATTTANTITAEAQGVAPAPAPEVAPAPAPEVSPPEPSPYPPEVQRLLAIEVPVIVQLGVRKLSVGEVVRFAVGAIIEFQKAADEELELLVNNKTIGRGHAVKVGENFGIKLTAIDAVKETIRKLGGIAE